jgi:LemA protein
MDAAWSTEVARGMTTSLVLGISILLAAVWIYNRLVRDRNQVRNAWSDIDVQLKRRHDLVPQLVAAVKAYADYEKATLTAVTELRARSQVLEHLPEKAAVEDAIEAGLHRLVAVAEDYPDLKADANFRQLQQSLLEVEEHLQYSRRFYNGAVRILNTRIESFPHLLLANALGFRPAEFFLAAADEREAPAVVLR